MANATKTSSAGLSGDLLKQAIASREEGKPLPPGVTWNPGRVPQFLSAAEQDEYDSTGQMPAGAKKRAETEYLDIPSYGPTGNRLTVEQVKAAREGGPTTPPPAPTEETTPTEG